jgi:hypothetical protein
VTIVLFVTQARAVELVADTNGGVTQLKLVPPDQVFHTTQAAVTDEDLIDVDGSLLLMHWKETIGGATVPYYAFSFDGGVNVSHVRRTSYVLKLRYAEFDPLLLPEGPWVPPSLEAGTSDQLYIVQFFTQAFPELPQFRVLGSDGAHPPAQQRACRRDGRQHEDPG